MSARFGRGLRGLAVGLALAWAGAAWAAPPVYTAQIKATYPHDTGAFTEGLFWLDGGLYESTGEQGRSDVRRVRLADGAVLQRQAIPPNMFGEGVVNWGDELISLTWRDGTGFRWNRRTLTVKSTFSYRGEGWGLTQNGAQIIMSDGTPQLRFLDPKTLKELRRLTVTNEGRPLANLNELEWVKGEIFANVWQTPLIARIDPKSGAVKGWIDLSGLPEVRIRRGSDPVPNGIAYDAAGDRLFVTGKNWAKLYEITLKPKAAR